MKILQIIDYETGIRGSRQGINRRSWYDQRN